MKTAGIAPQMEKRMLLLAGLTEAEFESVLKRSALASAEPLIVSYAERSAPAG
jgi:hypothetical protein